MENKNDTYQKALNRRVHAMLNGIPFDPFELDKFREKPYVLSYPYEEYVKTCEMTGNIPITKERFENVVTRTLEERKANGS